MNTDDFDLREFFISLADRYGASIHDVEGAETFCVGEVDVSYDTENTSGPGSGYQYRETVVIGDRGTELKIESSNIDGESAHYVSVDSFAGTEQLRYAGHETFANMASEGVALEDAPDLEKIVKCIFDL